MTGSKRRYLTQHTEFLEALDQKQVKIPIVLVRVGPSAVILSLTVCCEIVAQFPCIILASPFLQLMAARREGAMLLVVRPRFAAYTLCNTLCIIIIYNDIGYRTKAFHVNCQTTIN